MPNPLVVASYWSAHAICPYFSVSCVPFVNGAKIDSSHALLAQPTSLHQSNCSIYPYLVIAGERIKPGIYDQNRDQHSLA